MTFVRFFSGILLLASALAACGTDSRPAGRSKKSASADATAEEAKKKSPTEEERNKTVEVKEGSPFALFCEETVDLALKDDSLVEFRDGFCAGEQPKALLAEILPRKAYTGEGEPTLLKIKDVEQDAAAKTTAITVAGAVKLTVKAQVYFEGMTRYAGDPAAAKAHGVQLIDGVVSEENVDTYESEGSPHVKGWQKHVSLENKVSSQIIKSEYESRLDHYELVKGKVYLFATYLTDPIKGVKENALLAALLDDGKDTYLLAQVRAKTDNRGLPDVARDTLTKIAKAGLKNVHSNAGKVAAP